MIQIILQRSIALESGPELKEIASQTFSGIFLAFRVLERCAETNETTKAFAVSWFSIHRGAPHWPTAFFLHLSHCDAKAICLISRNERSYRP
jgi:4'-phosphopantetheinyl transferase EntD